MNSDTERGASMVENNVIAFPARRRERPRGQPVPCSPDWRTPPAIPPMLLGVLVAGYVALWLLCLWFIGA